MANSYSKMIQIAKDYSVSVTDGIQLLDELEILRDIIIKEVVIDLSKTSKANEPAN